MDIEDVRAAAGRIAGAVVETPTTYSATLSEITGAEVWVKFENLQFTSSFKERGALNFLLAHRPQRVVAASAGNHAQGVAHHAARLGIPATIVMPADTPFTKVTRTEVHGATVVVTGDDFAAALAYAQQLAHDTDATFVPAFDDPLVIAGQGTVALEMLAAAPQLDTIVVPVGGGGLISGIAIAAKATRPDIQVIGAQTEGYASMLYALGRAPAPPGGPTIAEGIAVTEAGTLTREIVRELVDDVLVVSEQRIEEAVALAIEIEKTVVEGAGAAGLAALIEHRDRFQGRTVGVVLSGGNIDLRVLSSVMMRALARSGRIVRLSIEVPDRPGVLAAVANVIGTCRGNIVDVTHRRDLPGVALKVTMLELSVETRDQAHADEIVRALRENGFQVA